MRNPLRAVTSALGGADDAPDTDSDDDTTDEGDEGADETSLQPASVADDLGTALGLLDNPRRRVLIRRLAALPPALADEGIDFATAVDWVAAAENEIPADQLTRDQRQRVYVSLYQTHVPRLIDHGIVDAVEAGGRLRPTPATAIYDDMLSALLPFVSEACRLERAASAAAMDALDDATPASASGASVGGD